MWKKVEHLHQQLSCNCLIEELLRGKNLLLYLLRILYGRNVKYFKCLIIKYLYCF